MSVLQIPDKNGSKRPEVVIFPDKNDPRGVVGYFGWPDKKLVNTLGLFRMSGHCVLAWSSGNVVASWCAHVVDARFDSRLWFIVES